MGYKIGLELMVKCDCKNVVEIPITFQDRLHGESKLNFSEQLNYLRHIKRLYEYRLGWLARPLQFVLIGSSGMIVDLSFFALLSHVLSFGPARASAIWLAMTWNFMLNRRLTFSYAQVRIDIASTCSSASPVLSERSSIGQCPMPCTAMSTFLPMRVCLRHSAVCWPARSLITC